jgi:hypothetical protein
MARLVTIVALVSLVAASPLGAQESETLLGPSSRVRVWPAGSSKPVIGVLHRLDADSVAVGTSGASLLLLARDSVARLDVSRGVHANTWRYMKNGALIGGAVGALGSVVAVFATEADQSGYLLAGVVALTGGGAVAGALLGTVAGVTSRSEQWRRVSLDGPGLEPIVMWREGRTMIGMRLGAKR